VTFDRCASLAWWLGLVTAGGASLLAMGARSVRLAIGGYTASKFPGGLALVTVRPSQFNFCTLVLRDGAGE
jgi:hypothetical protein